MGWNGHYLGCESIHHLHGILVVGNLLSQQRGDVSRPCRAGLVLESSQISLHLLVVAFQLYLMGESDVGFRATGQAFSRAEDHDSLILILL